MAYASVVTVVQILEQLLHFDSFPVHYPKPQIESLHRKVISLQSSFEKVFPVPKSSRNAVNALEIQIRNAMCNVQDTVEYFISRQIRSSESEEIPGEQSSFPQDLEKIIEDIDAMAKSAEEIAGSMRHRREHPQTGDWLSENSSSGGKSSKIVGQEEDLDGVTKELLKVMRERQVVPITGLAGIGKTTLARSIYDSKTIESHFDIRAWVTVSQECHVGDIFLKLLGSMVTKGQKNDASDSIKNLGDKASQQSDWQLSLDLHKSLSNKRYLVVIDDIWDTQVWDDLRISFPDNENGSRIVLTTRNAHVAKYAKTCDFIHEMRPLDLKKSWELLCEKVFAGGECPPSMEGIGKKIANDCDGLPLSITVVGGQLSQERKTVEYWELVEEDIRAAVSQNKESYLEILSLSYNHLPARLKGCFLYIAAFPEDREILVSKLIKLWVAEGFLIPSPSEKMENLEQVAKQHLKNLVDRNLVLVHKFSTDGQIKSCGMHDSVREIAVKRCQEDKFFHFIKRYAGELSKDMESQWRLSIHRNILMCMEDVYHCTKSITSARTLLYAGPYHHHPLPFCLTFELLRVLDALTVYLIKFPNEVVKLIHLRYLSLTYNGNLPPSISKLRNLQTLIVRHHPKIIFVHSSILPVEIWNMPQIKHLQFSESGLPNPAGVLLLENLQTLSNVYAACCTKEVLENMPNLKKLGIWIEAPGAVQFHVDLLQQLEAFKFTVLNPDPESELDFLPEFVLPKTLKKLSLSGCGLPWEKMKVIGQLPKLEVLKLREMSFQGTTWSAEQDGYRFGQLKFLLLESLDLVTWDADDTHFPCLQRLIINYCLDLEEIPYDFLYIGCLKLIELVDCNPSVEESACDIRDADEDNKNLQVRIYSSWE